MTLRVRASGTLLLLTCLLSSGRALAEPTQNELSAARISFREAVALEGEQKWAEAAAKLHEALAVKDTPGLRFHLAHCEEQQGMLLEAAADYDRATELIAHGAKAPDVQKLLAPASADVKNRTPRVIVELPPDVASVAVLLDGKAALPSELAQGQLLNPGAHELRVSSPQRTPFVRALSLKEGDRVSVRVELPLASNGPAVIAPVPAVSATPSTPAVDSGVPRTSHRGSAKPYLLVGEAVLTAAGLAIGIGYAVAASSARDRVTNAQAQIDHASLTETSACSMPDASIGGSCAALRTAIDDHDRDTTLSVVGFVGAGVGAAALITTALVFPSAHETTSGVSVAPTLSFGRIGLRGSF